MMENTTYGDPTTLHYPKLNGQTVIAVKKNSQGDIESFKLEDGTILSYEQAAETIRNNQSEGLLVQEGNAGQLVIRSSPDAHEENNLDNLPTFDS